MTDRGRRGTPAGGRQRPTPGSAADDGPDADPAEVARTLVLRSLNAAPRTRAQLADLLASRGVPDDIAVGCLDRFEDLRLIDDAEYARMWVRSRHEQRGLPRRSLRYELQRKGVPREAIEAALDMIDEDSEFDAALALARRKVASLASQPLPVVHRRTMAALLRKGFSSEVAARALRAAQAEPDDDEFSCAPPGW